VGLAVAALVLGAALPASALPGGGKTPQAIADAQQPPQVQGVDVEEHLGEPLPLEARFTDATGREIRLGDVLPKDKPTLVTLVYYECPMLCGLVLNAVRESVQKLSWLPGDHYRIVTISIDPDETPKLAAAKKASITEAFPTPEQRNAVAGNWSSPRATGPTWRNWAARSSGTTSPPPTSPWACSMSWPT
jgi:protein SCO1/2